MNKSIALLGALLVLFGCSVKDHLIDDSKACEGSISYVKDQLNLESRNNHMYLILGSEHCNPCSLSVINWCLKNLEYKSHFTVVIVGSNYGVQMNNSIKHLEKQTEIVYDPRNYSRRYKLTLSKPLVISYNESECFIYKYLESNTVHRVLTELLQFNIEQI